MNNIAILLSLIWGVLVAVQSPTNGALSKFVGSTRASMISFLGGASTTALLTLLLGKGNLGLVFTVPAWQLLGGLYGLIAIICTTISVNRLGVALTLVGLMVGQLIAGLLIDTFGLFGTAAMPLSCLRIIGLCIALLGIICIYISKKNSDRKNDEDQKGRKIIFYLMLMILGGFAGSTQVPTNAALASTVGRIEASFVSCFGGFLIAAIASLLVNKGKWNSFKGVKPWMCLGGLYGGLGILSSVIAMPYLGVVLLMVGTMFGQLFTGMLIDIFGWFRTKKQQTDIYRITGIGLFAVCIIVTALGRL